MKDCPDCETPPDVETATSFDDDVCADDFNADDFRVGLEHVPAEIWEYARSIARSEDIVLEMIAREDKRVCRRVRTEAMMTMGANRWKGAWRHQPNKVKRRLGRHRDEAIQKLLAHRHAKTASRPQGE